MAEPGDDLVDRARVGRVGRVVRVDRGECDVQTARGGRRVASDPVRAQDRLAPVTGDWVELAELDGVGTVIEAIVPRGACVQRRDPVDDGRIQVLAANVDAVATVHGVDRPLAPGRIERLMVLAEDSGAEPLVVLTKVDLADPDAVDDMRAVVAAVAPGVDVVTVSNVTGAGLDEVRRRLARGRTLALIGPSGTGKSSLVNALAGREVLEVGEVRPGDARGRHTTTARCLVALPGPEGGEPGEGGLILDTPGIRAIGLADATEALERVFGDIEALAAACRFADCSHDGEPGCAVEAAVEAGRLDPRRVERHRALRAEIAEQAERARRRGSRSGSRSAPSRGSARRRRR